MEMNPRRLVGRARCDKTSMALNVVSVSVFCYYSHQHEQLYALERPKFELKLLRCYLLRFSIYKMGPIRHTTQTCLKIK